MRVNLKSTRNQEAQLGPRRTRRCVRLGQCEARCRAGVARRGRTKGQNGPLGLGPALTRFILDHWDILSFIGSHRGQPGKTWLKACPNGEHDDKVVAGRNSGEATGEAVPREGWRWRNRMFHRKGFRHASCPLIAE